MAGNSKGEFPSVWIMIALFLIVFWGAVCFGPQFMRDFMSSVFDFMKALVNV